MKTLACTALLSLLALSGCKSAATSDSLLEYRFNPTASELTVLVKLPSGKHAYAPGEPVGRPVELQIDKTNNWELASPASIPQGDARHLISDSFEVKAKLKNGHGPVHGIFKMQLCSDTSCERPRDYAFKVAL
ncbi:MAG: hypothetical protein V4534_01155 [Myxococcota bacterium]